MLTHEEFMDIWSLHKQGLSQRQIAKRLGIHRRTVQKYLQKGERGPYQRPKAETLLDAFAPQIQAWLQEDDYQASWIFRKLKEQGYSGSYETVKAYVRKEKRQRQQLAYIRFETQPGLQAQVDFSELKVETPHGPRKWSLFVMVLGYSRHAYAELVADMRLKTFLECHLRAFTFFGGVPLELVYDNLKNVVVRRLVGKIHWNATMLDFASHTGFKLVACSPYAPWSKGKVERLIQFIQESLWRGYDFEDLTRANADIQAWLTEQAQRVHGTTREVVSVRFAREQLSPVPARAYDTRERVVRKVAKDCTVAFGGNRYVVPHRLVGQELVLKADATVLEIFADGESVLSYLLATGRGHLVQDPALYEALRQDQAMNQRKFGRKRAAPRARQLPDAWVQPLLRRSLSEYEEMTGGNGVGNDSGAGMLPLTTAQTAAPGGNSAGRA